MVKWLLVLTVFFTSAARAQYYYNDIWSNRIAQKNYTIISKAGVRLATVNSFDPDGSPTQGFNVKQEISRGSRTIVTTSQNAYSNPSELTTVYNAAGWPVTATDSSSASVSQITYAYTGSDTMQKLTTVTTSTGFPGEGNTEFTETRTYTYNGNRPVSMLRIKNRKDTMLVTFTTEEHGLVGEERWTQKGHTIDIYYYYYDATGRMTDVAHYNRKAQRILPDYTFEYNVSGQLTSMITFVTGTNQYRTWRYTYDARGLKTEESVMNKNRQQEGKLVYSYQ